MSYIDSSEEEIEDKISGSRICFKSKKFKEDVRAEEGRIRTNPIDLETGKF